MCMCVCVCVRERGENFLCRREESLDDLEEESSCLTDDPKIASDVLEGRRRTAPVAERSLAPSSPTSRIVKSREIGSKFLGKRYVDSYQADCRG